ncbi:STAS domain-containing protein [Gymnodinialimonas sp. 2305UL16-5]|uniref:STAS domain-containing protein n=1 Tax=Gymnodinialimonas mytili TaxID=3126503 RepID=UPI0030ABAFE4
MTHTYALPQHLDSAAAPPLAFDLLSLRGKSIAVDGSQVDFAGALGLQVLISAKAQWAEDGIEYALTPVSAALDKACNGLGVAPHQIGAAHDDMSEGEPDR